VTGLVEMVGEVVRVVPGGFEDHVEGGTVARDQAVVRVTAPAELAGRMVRVVVDGPVAAASLGREGPVAFAADPADLELDAVFSGALEDLRRLPEAGR
jgi:hypothetical protein